MENDSYILERKNCAFIPAAASFHAEQTLYTQKFPQGSWTVRQFVVVLRSWVEKSHKGGIENRANLKRTKTTQLFH